MKPWFVKEADIIKFPEPKAKVVELPNVQSYPDFLTGVKDLHNRKAKGEISQDSHDRLYTDLIHRFMKKENVETPWFLNEAKNIGKPRGKESLATYIANVNKLLKTNHSFPVVSKSQRIGNLMPDPGQQVNSADDIIKGTLNGKPVDNVKVRHLEKSAEIKGKEKKSWNLGYVSEGLFAIGLWLGLRFSKEVDGRQIAVEAMKLKNKNTVVPGINPETKDQISLRINLSDNNWEGLISPDTYQNQELLAQLRSIANYVNTSKDFKSIDVAITQNKKVDKVQVVADGIGDQKGSTVDVYIQYVDGTQTEFKRSLKSGKVTQFGQGPAGGKIKGYDPKKPDYQQMKDAPKNKSSDADPARYSREERWEYQEIFWEQFGIDISGKSIGKDEEGNEQGETEEYFMNDPSLANAFFYTYEEAAKMIDAGLKSDRREKKFLKQIFNAVKQKAGAKIVHTYDKGYTVMDPDKLDDFVDTVNLGAEFDGTGKRPRVLITDQDGEVFIKIELEVQESKTLNAINMGDLLKKITTIDQGKN
jgi:hypothetical protein